MPLPFLAKKKQAGLIVEYRKPDEGKDQEKQEDSTGIEQCAKDLIEACKAEDVKAAARAIKDAFTILDSQPHDEGEHTNDYDDMNERAAQENE